MNIVFMQCNCRQTFSLESPTLFTNDSSSSKTLWRFSRSHLFKRMMYNLLQHDLLQYLKRKYEKILLGEIQAISYLFNVTFGNHTWSRRLWCGGSEKKPLLLMSSQLSFMHINHSNPPDKQFLMKTWYLGLMYNISTYFVWPWFIVQLLWSVMSCETSTNIWKLIGEILILESVFYASIGLTQLFPTFSSLVFPKSINLHWKLSSMLISTQLSVRG